MPSLKLTVKVKQALFDPNDEVTTKFNEKNTIVQVFLDHQHIGYVIPDAYEGPVHPEFQSSCTFKIPEQFITSPKAVVRLIAKDVEHCKNKLPGTGLNDDIDARVGTISFNKEYFLDIKPASYGQSFVQNITLFDEVDDDDFDGELNEDDEELPIVRCEFIINDKPTQDEVPSPQKVAPPIEQPAEASAPTQAYENPKRAVKSGIVPPRSL